MELTDTMPTEIRRAEPWLAIVWADALGDLDRARRLWVDLEVDLAIRQRELGIIPAVREHCDDARIVTTSLITSVATRSGTAGGSATVAEVQDGGRHIYGCAVPYGQPAIVRDTGKVVRETFDRRSIPDPPPGLPMLAGHRRDTLAVARVTGWDNQPGGLHFTGRLMGAEVDAERHRDRIGHGFDAVSIGFLPRPEADEWTYHPGDAMPQVLRRQVQLDHLAFVNDGAYASARVRKVTVRQATPALDRAGRDPVLTWAATRTAASRMRRKGK